MKNSISQKAITGYTVTLNGQDHFVDKALAKNTVDAKYIVLDRLGISKNKFVAVTVAAII